MEKYSVMFLNGKRNVYWYDMKYLSLDANSFLLDWNHQSNDYKKTQKKTLKLNNSLMVS